MTDDAIPKGPVVERQGFDLADHTVRKVLPVAAELCRQGVENEQRLQRDPARYQRRVIDCYAVTEMRDVNGLQLPVHFVETCEAQSILPRLDRAPVKIPILRAATAQQLHWALYLYFLRTKTFGHYNKETDREARRWAAGSVTFRIVGSKESSVFKPGAIAL